MAGIADDALHRIVRCAYEAHHEITCVKEGQ